MIRFYTGTVHLLIQALLKLALVFLALLLSLTQRHPARKNIPFVLPLLSLIMLAFAKFHQADYDIGGIEIRRLLRRPFRIPWNEIQKIKLYTYRQVSSTNLGLALYYNASCHGIKQHQLCKGFPEFEKFMTKIIETYQIPVRRIKQ